MFKSEYSIQSLLNMNIEQNLYRRCIEQVKSPLQTFNLSHSTLDSGSKLFDNSPSAAYSTTNSFHQINSNNIVNNNKTINNNQSRNRSISRTRKKIFDQSPKLKKSESNFKGSEVGCWEICMNNLIPSPTKETPFDQIKTSRSQHITIKQYSPFQQQYLLPQPLQKLHYQNSNIPEYQSQFIGLLLKIIPKLYLRNQLASHLFVNKSQLLQTLLAQPYKNQRQQGINNVFSSKLTRIDRRFNSPNMNQFISKLTMTSNRPLDNFAEKQVIESVKKIIDLLNQVEDDIRGYLSSKNRVKQLQYIYEELNLSYGYQSKTLCLLIYQYLNKKGVSCRQSNIQTLSYVWQNIKYKHYSLQEFVDEIVKNDIIVKRMTESQSQLEQELAKRGFMRNI